MTEPFFFNGTDGVRLMAVWRAPREAETSGQNPRRVWVVCPPFAEEEKSARRTLVEGCEKLRAEGDASLFFALRGTGDSEGDFATATIAAWRDDIRAACREARRRAPDAALCLLGLRLGASLAASVASEVGASRLVLIEPILNGRRYLSEMGQRKKLRAMMTQQDGAASGAVVNGGAANGDAANAAKAAGVATVSDGASAATPAIADDVQDMDGWAIAPALRDGMNALDLLAESPSYASDALILQVGPREQIAPPLARFAQAMNAPCRAVVARPFWNLLDYARSDALWQQVQ